jgi:hypothetical protein
MSRYPYPRHFCQMLQDLDLYSSLDNKEFKNIDAEFQVEVGYLVYFNHL